MSQGGVIREEHPTIKLRFQKRNDAPPSSLMDSTTSLKVKTMKGEGVGACSLARNTLGVEGHVGALGWD
jgi:hypothetical protein